MPYKANISWLNQNEERSYPIVLPASKKDVTGAFRLPDDFILEINLPVHAGLDVVPTQFFIYQVTVYGSVGVGIVIAYDNGSSTPTIVATVSLAASAHKEFNTYAVAGVNDFDDIVGTIVIGKLTSLVPGAYTFDLSGTQLETDAIRPMIRGISSMSILNGTEQSPRFYGDIVLVAGTNVRLTTIITEGSDPTIRIDAIQGEGLNAVCVCSDSAGTPITQINGIPPTAMGDFTFLGSDCIQINPITNGIQLIDSCSKPCCDCPELSALNQTMQQIANGFVTVQGFAARMDQQVQLMSTTVLSAQLSGSCNTC